MAFNIASNNVDLSINYLRHLVSVVNNIMNGKTNNTGSVTLTANTTTTTISDLRVGPDSVILLMPTTANATAESPYISSRGKQTFTITHANAASVDRTFAYAVIG